MHARPPPRPLWLFSARGSGSLYLPATLRLPFPVGLFCFALCPSLFFLSGYLRGSLSLCLLLSTCPAVSWALFRAQTGPRELYGHGEQQPWLAVWLPGLRPRTAAFAGVEAAGRPRKHTFPERARAFARRKLILKLSVLFPYGPTQDKVASGRSDPGPRGKKAPCHFD